VSIRPEKIWLQAKAPEGAENCFEAVIEEEIFKGATDLLRLRTDAGLTLTAVVANESSSREAVHAGDRVWCQLHPDDIVFVHED
jgi:spermidine/putrescine transport system ATP-binding protein